MLRTRVIPALLLEDESLVKTERFRRPVYVGDPPNTLRIFNELEVDELLFLDIRATLNRSGPPFPVLRQIANECFMPVAYGGGIDSLEIAARVLGTGFEKVSLNSAALERPELITEVAGRFGSQAVIVSIDVKRGLLGRGTVRGRAGRSKTGRTPVDWAREVEDRGAGELLLTSIDREGTWTGFDLDLVREVSEAVSIPVIAHGGAGNVDHIDEVVNSAGASAVALGSMVVFQKRGMGVLINFPDRHILEERLH